MNSKLLRIASRLLCIIRWRYSRYSSRDTVLLASPRCISNAANNECKTFPRYHVSDHYRNWHRNNFRYAIFIRLYNRDSRKISRKAKSLHNRKRRRWQGVTISKRAHTYARLIVKHTHTHTELYSFALRINDIVLR